MRSPSSSLSHLSFQQISLEQTNIYYLIASVNSIWLDNWKLRFSDLMASSSSWGSWTRIFPTPSASRASGSQSRSRSHLGWSSSAKARVSGLCAPPDPICLRAICWCPGSVGVSPRKTLACTSLWTRSQKHLGTTQHWFGPQSFYKIRCFFF